MATKAKKTVQKKDKKAAAKEVKKSVASKSKPAPKKAVAKKAPVKAVKKVAKPAAAPKSTKVAAAPTEKLRKVTKPKSPKGVMTQSEFVENLQGFCGLAKKAQAKEYLEDFLALLVESIKKGYKVTLPGFGKIYVIDTKAREGINPLTKQPIKIPAKKRVRFSASKTLKEAVL